MLDRLIVAVVGAKAAEGTVPVDHRRVLVAVIERAKIHTVGEDLMAKIDVLEREAAHFGRRRIGALIILKPAKRRIALVSAAGEIVGKSSESAAVVFC